MTAENGSKKRKLILHFDVNETILVGDPAGGDSMDVINQHQISIKY
jgi:hypothetical protein